MTKTEQLNQRLNDEIRQWHNKSRNIGADVFYGDCSCEYINDRHAKKWGWHLRLWHADKGVGMYLGEYYVKAYNNLTSSVIHGLKQLDCFDDAAWEKHIPF